MAKSWEDVTPDEWFQMHPVKKMLQWVRSASGRKLRLWACASCRLIWKHISEPGCEMILAAEEWADDEITLEELNAIRTHCEKLLPRNGLLGGMSHPHRAAVATATPWKAALDDLPWHLTRG